MRIIVVLLLLAKFTPVLAAGPEVIAYSDRSLWPDAINSTASFDRASRAEILAFVAALDATANQDADALKKRFHIKQVDLHSVSQVKQKLMAKLFTNWNVASASCTPKEMFCPKIDSQKKLVEAGRTLSATLPDAYRNWYANAQTFDERYAGELVRLAALFPVISSEIDTFSPIEHTGLEFPDRRFLLTFDDGPTPATGYTDSLLSVLSKAKLHATFYMLGENLQARLKRADAAAFAKEYEGQCTAVHGWLHKSHAKWDKWQESILDTRALVKATFPAQYRPWFRPPYGQRQPDSGDFFTKNDLQVALWNIDSQDWNSHIDGLQAAQRVFTLMLIWRRGVILFHDVHPKALDAVPWLLDHTKDAGIMWEDCRS